MLSLVAPLVRVLLNVNDMSVVVAWKELPFGDDAEADDVSSVVDTPAPEPSIVLTFADDDLDDNSPGIDDTPDVLRVPDIPPLAADPPNITMSCYWLVDNSVPVPPSMEALELEGRPPSSAMP